MDKPRRFRQAEKPTFKPQLPELRKFQLPELKPQFPDKPKPRLPELKPQFPDKPKPQFPDKPKPRLPELKPQLPDKPKSQPSMADKPKLEPPTREQIRDAYRKLAESGLPYTKMVNSRELDKLSGGVKIYIACENVPPVNSFKRRAARLELSSLPPETHVVIASSGNQALAFAHEAQKLGIRLTAVLPEGAPAAKVDAIKVSGAQIIQHGATYDKAYNYAQQYSEKHGTKFIDVSSPESVSALSTVVWEMLERVPHADAIILPAGGGTLLAGGSEIAKEFAKMRGREILVFGAVPEGAATTYESFKARKLVTVNNPNTIADATKVETTDKHLLPRILQYVDDIAKVPENQIKWGMKRLNEITRRPVEGAGALGTMAVVGNEGIIRGARGEYDLCGKTVVTVITGGNVDRSKLEDIKLY